MVLFTIGEMVASPVTAAYVANFSPAHMRGRYAGAFGLTWPLALIFAPGLGMKMLAYNPVSLWFSCWCLGLLAAGIILMDVTRRKVVAETVKV
jgi:MFS family permease